MKTTICILLLLLIGFSSCDGRKTKNQSLSESIEEFKKSATIEIDIYKPENFVERKIDTLLSNGYHVTIKTYTDMYNSVLFTKIKDTINYQTFYRNYEFDILVEKDDQLIFKESFNKDKLQTAIKYNADTFNFEELAVLKSIEIDDYKSLNDHIVIDILYTIPETDKTLSNQLVINKNGKSNFILTETK